MITETREVRWFFASAPTQFESWQGVAEERTDWYAPNRDSRSSVKLREGNLEAKFLLQEQDLRLQERLDGRLQHWRKFSLPIPTAEISCFKQQTLANWLEIRKKRRLRFYRVHQGRLTRQSQPSPNAVQVEWTEIKFLSRDHWTLGLEAPAQKEADCLGEIWELVVQELDLDFALFTLSQAYPAWIKDRIDSMNFN